MQGADGWTETNGAERHLRIGGKIVGKIRKGYQPLLGGKSIPWNKWLCQVHTPRLQTVGERVKERDARRLVESAIARWAKFKARGDAA